MTAAPEITVAVSPDKATVSIEKTDFSHIFTLARLIELLDIVQLYFLDNDEVKTLADKGELTAYPEINLTELGFSQIEALALYHFLTLMTLISFNPEYQTAEVLAMIKPIKDTLIKLMLLDPDFWEEEE